MTRHFSHLSLSDTKSIVMAVLLGEKKTEVAKRFNLHHSTVIYHFDKYKGMKREDVIALVTPTCEKCSCTMFKCPTCGKSADNIKSNEYQEIFRLRDEVKKLTFKIKQYEENHFFTSRSAPALLGIVG